MQIRLLFWCVDNPTPYVIAHGNGGNMRSAMAACFAPFNEPGWKYTVDDWGDGYLLRGRRAGYCGQTVVDGERIRRPKTNLSLPRVIVGEGRKIERTRL